MKQVTALMWMRRGIVSLLMGAIVNAAVAWGFALFVSLPSNRTPLLDQSRWWDTHPRGGENVLAAWRWSTTGFERRVMCGGDPGRITINTHSNSIDMVRSGPGRRLVELSTAINTGWPKWSLGGETWMTGVAPRSAIQWLLSGSWPVGQADWVIEAKPPWQRDSNSVRLIPLRPLWPGFAINTVFYAAILWLLFAAPFALRRHRRIRRGLCPACAYPIGDSEVCTECGSPVKAKRVGGNRDGDARMETLR